MTFTITFKNTKKFEKLLQSSRHLRILRVEVGKATADNLIIIQEAIVRRIKRKDKPHNSPFTKILKDGSVPLIDTGEMMKAVEAQLQDAFTGVVGFLKDQKTSHGGQMSKVIPNLEKGFTVKITPKMREWMIAKMREAGVPPAGASGRKSPGVLRIPPRPFITPVFKSKRTRAKIQKNWKDAVKRAYVKMGAL